MHLLNFYDLGALISNGLWVLMDATILVAGIFFFRVEKRFHTVAIMVGAIISCFVDTWYVLESLAPDLLYPEDESRADMLWLLQMGIGVIGHALVAYGVITVALLQLRRHRAEASFGDDSPDSP